MEHYLGEIITGSLTALAGVGAWIFERKKRKTDNVRAIIELYQKTLDDLKNRYDAKFDELEADIKKLRESVNLWKGKYTTLKKEFDKYRAAHK